MRQDLTKIINSEFCKRKIIVVGDVIADQFLHGTIDRVSREAPVFILKHDKTETLPGGAGNAAVNVASLGGQVFLIGVVGCDRNGEHLLESLRSANVNCEGIVVTSSFETTTKVRVLASRHHATRQQVIRIDYESKLQIDESVHKSLVENFYNLAAEADAIIVSDYNYGVVSKSFSALVRDYAKRRGIPLLVDSRYRLRDFVGMTSATPNQEEVEDLIGKKLLDEADLVDHCEELRRELNCEALLVTRGSKGMVLLEKDGTKAHLEAVGSKEPVDVTGAGDTVIAAYSLALASGLSFLESAWIANHAGGIVVMKKGTASVTPEELIESINSDKLTCK